jgi:hypothetical protein
LTFPLSAFSFRLSPPFTFHLSAFDFLLLSEV